jgi:hypothetical protein
MDVQSVRDPVWKRGLEAVVAYAECLTAEHEQNYQLVGVERTWVEDSRREGPAANFEDLRMY